MTANDIARVLLEEVYKLSSTQINLPPDLANFVIEWGRLNIPDEDVYIDPEDGGKGRETEVHITVLYGIQTPTPSPALRKIIESTPQFQIELGEVSLFESEDYDVLKLDVISPELHALNARIAKAVPNENNHPRYVPHVTISYVRKNSANHLVGQDPFGEEAGAPRKFNATEISFKGAGDSEDSERVVEQIPLLAEHPEKAPGGMSYRVVWADGRGVQNFASHSDALRFSKDKERDADPPKLIRRPKGAVLREGVIETEANDIVDEIGRKMSEYGDTPKRFNAWAMGQPFKRHGIRFVRPRDDILHGGYHLDKHHIQLDCWNPKWDAEAYWQAIATSLPHELVHAEQHRRAGYRSDLGVGRATEPGYTDNPHEQMAQARSDAENVRRAKAGGMPTKTKDLIRQHYIHGSPISRPSFAGKKRYGKRLYQYLEPIVNEADEKIDPKEYTMTRLPSARFAIQFDATPSYFSGNDTTGGWVFEPDQATVFASAVEARKMMDALSARFSSYREHMKVIVLPLSEDDKEDPKSYSVNEAKQTYHVKPGQRVWFEYRCWESPKSADAKLWYRSHQQVTVGRMIERGSGKDMEERGYNGHSAVFKIKFDDGREFDATEDELMHSRSEFTRPDPPKRRLGESRAEKIAGILLEAEEEDAKSYIMRQDLPFLDMEDGEVTILKTRKTWLVAYTRALTASEVARGMRHTNPHDKLITMCFMRGRDWRCSFDMTIQDCLGYVDEVDEATAGQKEKAKYRLRTLYKYLLDKRDKFPT